ncbi:MAG: DeoR/GlpR family DNA-binding transcription regulator [Erysipelotrichaceae bacterium]|nr:DeoR/GlpR family DNA-binding transcription regulator [Erysipelotrichaceae bacterium]
MKKEIRWNNIIATIREQQDVSVQQLAETYNTSLSTIRRDLQEMEDLAIIERYYGGARINDSRISEPPMLLKSGTNSHSKLEVGRYAASLIKDNQMIFIDAGSATFAMLDYILARNITVVTNGIPHITKLISRDINTIVLGGTVRKSTMAITGTKALEQFNSFFFDLAFLGVNGIHPMAGLSTTNDYEASGKHMVITRSQQAYVLADHSKFNLIYPGKFADIGEVGILTDTIGDYPEPIDKCIETSKLKK